MAKEISGIAIFPRLSENDVFYWPQELKKFDGVTVPLRWNHIQTPEAIIGEATFTYNEDDRQVLYTATITNPDVQKEVDKGIYKVSIGASIKEDDFICHKDGQCAEAPILNVPEELSIVADPGIPESSLDILEGKKITLECANPIKITSTKVNDKQLNLMTSKTSVKEDCGCGKEHAAEETPKVDAPAQEEVPAKVEQECPPGQKWDGEKCVPMESEEVSAPAPETQSKDVTVNVNVPKTESKEIDVEKIISEAKESFMEDIRKEWTPKAQVGSGSVTEAKHVSEDKKLVSEAKETITKVLNEGHARIVLNKEDWIDANTQKTVSEAVTTSGTIPGVTRDTDIIIIPGNNTYKPVRQFGRFQSIPTGENTARFYTQTVAAFGALTESVSTPFTASTGHTLTAIDVTTSVRGWLQQVLKSNLEDWPETFMSTLQETARLAAVKDESNLVLTTLGGDSYEFNNSTAALAAGFPAHISGEDGTFVDSAVTEDAVGEFQKEGIEVARQHLETRGHDPVNEKIVAFLHPRAYRTLVQDPDISEFVQIGDPSISKLGRLEQFLGIEIIVTNELENQSNSWRNIMMVSGKSFALASQRDMEIEMDKEINGQYVNIVANHRIGVDALDKTAYAIISSKQD